METWLKAGIAGLVLLYSANVYLIYQTYSSPQKSLPVARRFDEVLNDAFLKTKNEFKQPVGEIAVDIYRNIG